MYHYMESGLDNIYLVNGYNKLSTEGGDALSIEDVFGLHRLIGVWLINLPKRLNGAELRFLRLEMELSQNKLGRMLGADEQSVRRWEKGRKKPIPGTADRMMRVVYSAYCDDGGVKEIIERIAELDEIEHASLRVRETSGHWSEDRAA